MNHVYCIRHGWSQHNEGFAERGMSAFEEKKYIKSSLTEKGKIQAMRLGNGWKEKNSIDIILCSPLERCIETALLIFGKNCKINILECLREYPAGLHWCNYRSSREELLNNYHQIESIDIPINDTNDNYFNKERFETKLELKNRVKTLKQYLKKYQGKTIAIVGHCSYFGELLGKNLEDIEHCHPYYIKL